MRSIHNVTNNTSFVAVLAIIDVLKYKHNYIQYRFKVKGVHMTKMYQLVVNTFSYLSKLQVENYITPASLNKKIVFVGRYNKSVQIGRIICDRKVQNIFITLVNDKGDVLSRYTLGYFYSKWAKNLSDEKKVATKVKELLHYKKQKRKYDKAKAKLFNSIKYKTIKRLVHTFCNKTIYKIKKNTNIKMIDLIFINLDNNIKLFVDIFINRFSLVGSGNKKINKKHFTVLQMRQLIDIIYSIQVELHDVIDLIASTTIKIKNIRKYVIRIYSYIFNYYLVLKYIVKNKYQINKFLNYHVFLKIMSIQIQPKYLYY